VAATLLNRNDSPTDEKREISGEDITTLLKMNPKEAAKQIVKGLKKTMSFEEQKVEEKQVNL
jgi:RNase H-fold protein (predicted Holliday junction resolvase)